MHYLMGIVEALHMALLLRRSIYFESEGSSPEPHDYSKDPLTFRITSSGNITPDDYSTTNYYYRKNDDSSWTQVSGNISVVAGDVVQFKGICGKYNRINFTSSTCGFSVTGNILSIYDETWDGSSVTLTTADCFNSLFKNCTGLTSAEHLILPTSLSNYCYTSMFYGCTSLTKAPILPVSDLVEGCYSSMFYGCSSLTYIKCLATSISARYCCESWVKYVSATGTFVKAEGMSSWTTDDNGIPSGWTVETDS